MEVPSDGVEASIRRAYRDVEFAVREGTLLIDALGAVQRVIKADVLIGVDADQLLGHGPVPPGWAMLDEYDVDLPVEAHPAMVTLRTGVQSESTLQYVDPSGGRRRLRFIAYPVSDDSDVSVDVVVSDADVRRAQRDALTRDDARFRTLTDLLPVSVWEAAASGEITYVNPAFTRLTGLDAEDAPDLPLLEIVHPDDLELVMRAATDAPEAGEYEAQYRVRHVDGTARWVTSRMAVLVGDDGKVTGYVGTIEDVDALHQAERYSRRLARIVENTGDPVAVYEGGTMVFVNEAATALLERADPSFATTGSHVFDEQIARMPGAELRETLRTEGKWSGDVSLFAADGERLEYAVVMTVEEVRNGVNRLVVQGRDIRDRKQRESELVHHARHDPLTGLSNRAGLDETIASSPGELAIAVFYVDIDHFKQINDEYGHAVGDVALRSVARRIRSSVAASDLVARVGGDEIVIWSVGATAASAEQIAERLVQVVSSTPIECDGEELEITCTIGVAAGVASDGLGLVERADAALYSAKRLGRNRWSFST